MAIGSNRSRESHVPASPGSKSHTKLGFGIRTDVSGSRAPSKRVPPPNQFNFQHSDQSHLQMLRRPPVPNHNTVPPIPSSNFQYSSQLTPLQQHMQPAIVQYSDNGSTPAYTYGQSGISIVHEQSMHSTQVQSTQQGDDLDWRARKPARSWGYVNYSCME